MFPSATVWLKCTQLTRSDLTSSVDILRVLLSYQTDWIKTLTFTTMYPS